MISNMVDFSGPLPWDKFEPPLILSLHLRSSFLGGVKNHANNSSVPDTCCKTAVVFGGRKKSLVR